MKYEITAKRIKEAMSDMGISQQELADKSKIGKSSISHYVNGTNEPGNKSAYMMSKVLNVNPGWLMGLDVPKHIENRSNEDIAFFFESLMDNSEVESIQIEDVRKIMDKAMDSKTSKALKMYELFLKAPDHIQKTVEDLLKGFQRES